MISDGSDDVAFKVNGDQMSRVNSGLKPHQPGNDKNRTGSMAKWVAPIRVYNHLSREIPIYFFNLHSMLSLFGRRLLIPTVGDIHSIHSSEMSGRSCEGRVARRSC